MGMNQINSDKKSKKINWKNYFNMRVFRRSFVKQLTFASTWILIIFLCLFSLISLFFIIDFYDNSNPKMQFSIQEKITYIINIFKIWLLFCTFTFGVVGISFNAIKIYHEKIEDKTLPISRSMPYSKLRLIFQKLLSLQLVWILVSFIAYFLVPTIILSRVEICGEKILKLFFKTFYRLFLTSMFIMLLVSSIVFFISIFLEKKSTIIFIFCTIVISVFMLLFSYLALISESNESLMEVKSIVRKIDNLYSSNKKNDLSKYLKDSELKDLFEIENWFADEKSFDDFEKGKNYHFTFKEDTIDQLYSVVNSQEKNIENTFLVNNIEIEKIEFCTSKIKPKAFQIINDLYAKAELTNKINLCSIPRIGPKNLQDNRVNGLKVSEKRWQRDYIDKNHPNCKFIRSFNEYKNAFDNINNLTLTEKKVVDLTKKYFESMNFKKPDEDNSGIKIMKLFNERYLFLNILEKQFLEKYPDQKEKMKNLEINQSVFYFVDSLPFQNLLILTRKISKIFFEFVHNKNKKNSVSIEQFKKDVETYFKKLKINNYLNPFRVSRIL